MDTDVISIFKLMLTRFRSQSSAQDRSLTVTAGSLGSFQDYSQCSQVSTFSVDHAIRRGQALVDFVHLLLQCSKVHSKIRNGYAHIVLILLRALDHISNTTLLIFLTQVDTITGLSLQEIIQIALKRIDLSLIRSVVFIVVGKAGLSILLQQQIDGQHLLSAGITVAASLHFLNHITEAALQRRILPCISVQHNQTGKHTFRIRIQNIVHQTHLLIGQLCHVAHIGLLRRAQTIQYRLLPLGLFYQGSRDLQNAVTQVRQNQTVLYYQIRTAGVPHFYSGLTVEEKLLSVNGAAIGLPTQAGICRIDLLGSHFTLCKANGSGLRDRNAYCLVINQGPRRQDARGSYIRLTLAGEILLGKDCINLFSNIGRCISVRRQTNAAGRY